MSFLLDTSVIVRCVDEMSPNKEIAQNAIKAALMLGQNPYLCSQNIIEFWSVATRPANKNGLGWTSGDVRQHVLDLQEGFDVLQNSRDVFNIWLSLVTAHGVEGKQVHDAHIAAFAIHYDVSAILTFNVDDFKRYTEIAIVHPADLVASV